MLHVAEVQVGFLANKGVTACAQKATRGQGSFTTEMCLVLKQLWQVGGAGPEGKRQYLGTVYTFEQCSYKGDLPYRYE